jgi:hypothetical protein
MDVDPPDAMFGVDEDGGRHRQTCRAIGVDLCRVETEPALRGEHLLAGASRQHSELGGQRGHTNDLRESSARYLENGIDQVR